MHNPPARAHRPPTRARRIRGVCGAILVLAVLAYLILIHQFLAISRPVKADVLVVEGWFANRPAMNEARDLIAQGHYRAVLCVGASAEHSATSASAQMAARRLIELGVAPDLVHALEIRDADRHRTFQMAWTAKQWLERNMHDARALNVFTLGVHARKSHVLFRKAFGPDYEIGIIAGSESTYSPKTWWASRIGWYLVVRNTVGYFYAMALDPADAEIDR